MSSPFDDRYGSHIMRFIFSDELKFSTWRRLWVALAETEASLGLNISPLQVEEMRSNIQNLNLDRAREIEKNTHHDVMAHILAYGEQCPHAKPIIHLGATSCFITDNTEVLQQRYALLLVRRRLIGLISALVRFAEENKDITTVGYTHYQVAQPTTVGKRACMWIQDLVMDLNSVTQQIQSLSFLGCKGATGTATSFLELFNGDVEQVKRLEQGIAFRIDMGNVFPISGQTYTRKQDFNVMQTLSGIAQSASKFANDVRLLSNMGEVMEVRGTGQVGSSAMPYKSNPINSERINSLSRFVICNVQNCAMTAATQWLERTLDDSANRRVVIPETFLATDEILATYKTVVGRLKVDTGVIESHVLENMDLFLTELAMMHAVRMGEDRQEMHEKIRQLTKELRGDALRSAIMSDPSFHVTVEDLLRMRCSITGMAEQQVDEYLSGLKSALQFSFDTEPTYD